MDNVHVVIRVRPLINTEESTNAAVHWKVQENAIWQLDGDSQKKAYAFDRIFSPSSLSAEIFDEVALPILDSVMEGYNGTIFAYGQTSSGKTHTMMGTETDLGVIPRVAKALFEAIEKMPLRKFLLRVSYMEIYNEKVYDLLRFGKKHLNIRENGNGKTFVDNLHEEFVGNCKDLLDIMKKGELSRSSCATHANEKSSRSHAIFTLTVESAYNQEDGEGVVMVSQLNLVDLAGSERASQSHLSGERFREGCAINTSLFTLRKVIKSLSQADGQFVCFRDSKLTRILQSSLGGNAKTSIICTVTPAMIEETHSTLQFASTAKTIRNQPTINEVLSEEALLKRYTTEIKSLQKKLETQNKTEKDQELKKMELKLQETSEKNQMLEGQLIKLRERIITSSLNSAPGEAIAKLNPNYRRLTWGGPRLCTMLPQRILSSSSPCGSLAPIPVSKLVGSSSDDSCVADESEIFVPGKKVRFERRFSDDCLVLTNDVECQTDLAECSRERDSPKLEALKIQVGDLNSENSRLSMRIATLNADLRSERASRIFAERRQNVDTTFLFLQEENSVQDEEIKHLKEQIATLTNLSLESEALKDVNNNQAQENEALKNNLIQLEHKLQNASKQFQAQYMDSQKELQKQLDVAQKKIEKLNMELKDAEIQYEQNHKHADMVKNELRQQLQVAYDRIEYLEQHNVCQDVSKFELCTKESGNKSIHELTLGAKDFSKMFVNLPSSPARQGTCGIDYDSEMQIVQMEFALRESSHLENIAAKDSRIDDLASQLGEAEKRYANLLQEMEDFKMSITKSQAISSSATNLVSQAPGQELDMKNWEARQGEMLKKIAALEEEISNYKSMNSIQQHPCAFTYNSILETPGDYPDMHEKIDALLRIVETFCQKEKSFIVEHPIGEDLDFRKHLKESRDYQEELQKKIEDLRTIVVQLKQKEQHVLGELEALKVELQNRQSLGDESTRTQKDAEETIVLQSNKLAEMNKVIQEMMQKEKHLVEKLENLEEHIRREGANTVKDVEGELTEVRKRAERLEADIIEYKRREEALSGKGPLTLDAVFPNVSEAETSADMKNELDQLRAMLEENRTLINNSKLSEESLVQEMGQLKEELHREREDSASALMKKIDEHNQLLQQHESTKTKLRNQLEESRNKVEEIERLEPENCKLLKELEKLKAEHGDKVCRFGDEIEDLKLQLTTYKSISSEARQKVSDAEAKRAELELNLQEYNCKVLEGKQKEDQLSAEVKSLREDLQRHRDQAAEEASLSTRTTQKLSELERKNQKMTETIVKYVSSEEAYLEELSQLRGEQELHRDCQDKVKEMQLEIARCAQREKQLRQYTQTLESDAKSKSDGNFNYRELLDELNDIREREVQLRDALKKKEAKFKNVQQQMHQYEENVDCLQQQLYDLKNEHDVLQTRLLEMEECEAKVEAERLTEVAKLRKTFAQKERDMLQTIEMAETRSSDLQIECEEMKQLHQTWRLKHAPDGSSVGVQCNLLRKPVPVRTAWTQVVTLDTETLRPSPTNRGTQCSLIGNAASLKDSARDQQTLWSFTFSKGIQCELLTHPCILQHHEEEEFPIPLSQTTGTASVTNVKDKEPQISEEDYMQLKTKLDTYEKENANLFQDLRKVRGTLYEHSAIKRMMQDKLSSLEENLEYMNGKCDQLKAEIRRLNSMKNMSIIEDSTVKQQGKSDDAGNCSQMLHSGISTIMRDNMEELQSKLAQLQVKYDKLKKLYMKHTTKKMPEQSPKHRMPAASIPEKASNTFSSPVPLQKLVDNQQTETKMPLNDHHGYVQLPFSGHYKQETMNYTKEPLSTAPRAVGLHRFLRKAPSSPRMDEDDENCKVS